MVARLSLSDMKQRFRVIIRIPMQKTEVIPPVLDFSFLRDS